MIANAHNVKALGATATAGDESPAVLATVPPPRKGLSRGPWAESGEYCRRGEWARSARDRAVVGVMGTSGMSARPLNTMDTISIMIWREAWVSSSAHTHAHSMLVRMQTQCTVTAGQ